MNKLKKYKKSKLSKAQKIIIAFVLIIFTIGIGYSALVTNLSIVGNMTVKKYTIPRTKTFPDQIENLLDFETCVTRYQGQVTDEVNNTVDAKNVYFNNCDSKRYFAFNDMCWQMIRTTETGGIKVIYSGRQDAYDGSCPDPEDPPYDPNNPNANVFVFELDGKYNTSFKSLADVGYMYNVEYETKIKQLDSTEYKFGNSFTYDELTDTYTLSGTTQNYSGLFTTTNTHYTCWNLTGTCSTLSYVSEVFKPLLDNYGWNPTLNPEAEYIELNGGKSVEDAINEMLYADDVNTKSSIIKKRVDYWFDSFFGDGSDLLEDVVYCNDRVIKDKHGWDPDNGSTQAGDVYFNGYQPNTSLVCTNLTDQFAVGNNKAKLNYPAGLITAQEVKNMSSYYLLGVNYDYWTMTPKFALVSAEGERITSVITTVDFEGYLMDFTIHEGLGVRPVVSLKNGIVITSGSGSVSNPWVIQE